MDNYSSQSQELQDAYLSQPQQPPPHEGFQFQRYAEYSEPYNGYNHHYDFGGHSQYPQHYSHVYANSYAHPRFETELSSIHPQGVVASVNQSSVPVYKHNSSHSAHNVYNPQESFAHQLQLRPNIEPTSELNHTAALPQFAHFAGGMDSSQIAMQRLNWQSSYRGGGRRGSKPFRGGRGRFSFHGQRPEGSSPSFHYRGRGRGRGGHPSTRGGVSIKNAASADCGNGIQLPPLASVPATSSRSTPYSAWCELCKVDCNTSLILEQHKNGKRHKKNLKMNEELQGLNKVTSEQKNDQMPNSELKPVIQSEKLEETEEKQEENQTSTVATDDNINEPEQQVPVENSEAPTKVIEEKSVDNGATQGRGLKRKLRGCQRTRTNEWAKRFGDLPRTKQVIIPITCGVCNVKCDTQAVFDIHLTGKKHQANMKRFHGYQALNGEAGVQALYPPNFIAPSTSATPQFQQDMNDPQVILAQLLMTLLSQAQAQASLPPLPGVVPAMGTNPITETAPGPSQPPIPENTHDQNCQTEKMETLLEDENQNHVIDESQCQIEPVAKETVGAPPDDESIDTAVDSGSL